MIANPYAELSWLSDQLALKELLLVLIKFVLDRKDYGLKIQPIIKNADDSWNMKVFTGSDYAEDVGMIMSVSRFCIILIGVPVVGNHRCKENMST